MASPERSVFKLDLNELAVVVTTMATIGVGVGGMEAKTTSCPMA